MAPCLDGVRRNIGAFLDGLIGDANRPIDCRLDFLVHSCDETFRAVRSTSLRLDDMELLTALYGQTPNPSAFFTDDPNELRAGLADVTAYGDEAMLVALDFSLDFPWRPRSSCHRVVALLTDEPLETNANLREQRKKIGKLIDKIHALGVMLFLVAPKSAGFNELAEADKCQYQQVAQIHDGLASLDFARVLAHIGKSVSVAMLQGGSEATVERALFGQDAWKPGNVQIRGGR
jgi:hypothetical protein